MIRSTTVIAAALLTACAGKPRPAPSPAPAAVPAAPAVAADLPPPADADWPDRPLTAGDWSYRSDAGGSEARFAGFGLRCDPARREVILSREGAGGPVRVRTTYGERALSSGAALPAADPLLDQMAFSRGRFAVEAEGSPMLIVPTWPEPARVIEDCRG